VKHQGCGGETAVMDSRPHGKGWIWRRRRCVKCSYAFTTFEITKKELKKIMEAQEKLDELDGPNWAVIAFRGVISTGISYSEAAELVKQLVQHPGNGGMTIVSADAAERFQAAKAKKVNG
jgi:transcriptional regulator NrdR family protein